MTNTELQDRLNEVPVYETIFTLSRVPSWINDLGDWVVQKGDELRYNTHDMESYHHIKSGVNFNIKPSYLTFKEYRKFKG